MNLPGPEGLLAEDEAGGRTKIGKGAVALTETKLILFGDQEDRAGSAQEYVGGTTRLTRCNGCQPCLFPGCEGPCSALLLRLRNILCCPLMLFCGRDICDGYWGEHQKRDAIAT